MNNLGLTNIFNNGRELVLFSRTGKDLNITTDKFFMPYYYEPSPSGIFKGYFGERLNKIVCREPYQIQKQRTSKSMEADVIYTKRYLIDKINITKADLRYVFFDIETKSKDLPDPLYAPDPITCITVYDNYTQYYKTFWTEDYETEYLMIEEFINCLKDIKPDLMLAWNGIAFDYQYLITRFPDFAEKISPIGKVIKRNNFPAGISIIDYMEWCKKVYKHKKHSLEYVYCDEFKLKYEPKKYNFNVVNDEIKEKNQADVRKMVELEKKLRLIPYFDEVRRLSKVLWEDLCMYSVVVDSFILQIAKQKGFILPTKPSEEEKILRAEDETVGGYVFAKPGLYEQVHLFDIGGTYPNLIRTFNLDPANKRKSNLTLEQNITTIRNVHIKQDSNAILPTVCSRLVQSRQEIQKQLETATGEEAELVKKKDEAHKALNNSVYGITLFKSSRLYDKDIAATITYLARFLIRYTKWYLRGIGMEVVASDTDSIFVTRTSDYIRVEKAINNEIIPKWLNHFGKTEGTLKFKYEGTYESLLTLTKKHYCGWFVNSKGERKLVKKGIEALRSDASKFQEVFQEELLTKILAKETKDTIISWIKSEIERMKQLPLLDVAFPVKLSKPKEAYKTEGIHVRALRLAQEADPNWQVSIGQDYYYTFIIPEKDEIKKGTRKHKKTKKQLECDINKEPYEIITVDIKKPINVWAFDSFSNVNFTVDYKEMEERNIHKKAETIFEALDWKYDLR